MWTGSTQYKEDLPGEVWKDVPNYEGEYQVSNCGRVRSFKTIGLGKVKHMFLLKPGSCHGYLQVSLFKKGHAVKVCKVHRLVALAFLGPCPEGYEVAHLDESRDNNRLDNLAYMTHAENMRQPKRLERMARAFAKYNKD